MDRRQLLRAAGLAGLAGVAGCGVASRNGVVVDEPGQPAGKSSGGSKQEPPRREALSAPEDLVHGLFKQAAWDLDDPNPAWLRWRSFFPSASEAISGMAADVTVVWCDYEAMSIDPPKGGQTPTTVTLPVTPLGTLEADGRITPDASSTYELTLLIGPLATDPKIKNDKTLWVLDMFIDGRKPESGKPKKRPKTMLLSSEALGTYYEYRNVYFWEKGLTCLVPEGRYVPTAWEDADRRKKLVEWVFAPGPPDWLAGAVEIPLPTVKVLDNPSPAGERLVVNLSADATKQGSLDRLVSQVTWTLLPEIGRLSADLENSPIILKIESNEKKIEHHYAPDNATGLRTGTARSIEAFAILDGRVERIQGPQPDPSADPPALLPPGLNSNVEWAAFCRNSAADKIVAAAVIRRESGVPRLYVGPRGKTTSLADSDRLAALTGAMLQPAFVDALNLLVVADGKLYNVRRLTGEATYLGVRDIQAFAVPPDGRRIAYVQNGKLVVRSLLVTATGGVKVVGRTRYIRTVLTDLTGVAFTAENWLAVAGMYGDEVRVVELSLDGGRVGFHAPDLQWLGGGKAGIETITSLTAFPDGPYQAGTTKRVYVTAGSKALSATSGFASLTDELVVTAPDGHSAINPFFLQ